MSISANQSEASPSSTTTVHHSSTLHSTTIPFNQSEAPSPISISSDQRSTPPSSTILVHHSHSSTHQPSTISFNQSETSHIKSKINLFQYLRTLLYTKKLLAKVFLLS